MSAAAHFPQLRSLYGVMSRVLTHATCVDLARLDHLRRLLGGLFLLYSQAGGGAGGVPCFSPTEALRMLQAVTAQGALAHDSAREHASIAEHALAEVNSDATGV